MPKKPKNDLTPAILQARQKVMLHQKSSSMKSLTDKEMKKLEEVLSLSDEEKSDQEGE